MSVTPVLAPSVSLLCKLGSVAVHTAELLSSHAHPADRDAIESLLADPDVVDWLAGMDAMALLPVRRSS